MSLPVDPARYAAFLSVMAVMAITPGPANLFAIATGMQKGKAAALVGVAGMNTGTLTWFAAAALGLGALIVAFPQVFHLLTFAGAAYVAWLGVKSIVSGAKNEAGPPVITVRPGRSAFVDGFTVQVSNPKALLFFTAVLPPFLDVGKPLPAQLAMFAAATIGMDVLSMSAYGLGGAALSERMSEPRFRRVFSYFVGALLITAALLMVTRSH
ncbi:MAG: LysE family translocator [Ignavibacteriales bacterium]